MTECVHKCLQCGTTFNHGINICPNCGGNNFEDFLAVNETLSAISTISNISGSLASGYANLKSTFTVRQKEIADTYKFSEYLPYLKQIADDSKKNLELALEQRKDAIEDSKR